jgi:hypothetical protein
MAYDNLKTAVIQINGRERRLTESFKQLRSHYLFESRFCNVAAGNEKGDVENLVKRSKRQYLTPVPEVRSLEQLAGLLFDGCEKDLERIDRGQTRTRRELLEEERARMLPLPQQPFSACRQKPALASKQALVRFDDNDYSIPSELALRPCLVRAFVDEVVILCAQQEVACRGRCYDSGRYVLDPVHFLGELSRKPGALDNALAFKSLLKDEDLQLLRRELGYRHQEAGDKQFIAILQLLKAYPPEAFAAAVSRCVRLRLFAVEAVRQELMNRPAPAPQWYLHKSCGCRTFPGARGSAA